MCVTSGRTLPECNFNSANVWSQVVVFAHEFNQKEHEFKHPKLAFYFRIRIFKCFAVVMQIPYQSG